MLASEGQLSSPLGHLGAAGLGSGVVLDMQLKQAPFAHHRGQVGEETSETKTAPEGAAVYRNIRASLLRIYAAS